FGALSGIKKGEMDSRIEQVLRTVGMSDYRQKKITELSGGNVQKVGLAQAILHEPELLILDEPLAGLDPASRYNVKQILRGLSKNGTTIFFSSHILSDVQDVANRIAILNRGCLMNVGTIDELKSEFITTNTFAIDIKPPMKDMQEIQSISGVLGIETIGEGRLLFKIDPSMNVDMVSNIVMKKLLDDGQIIRSFSLFTPNLDELYMRYTNAGIPVDVGNIAVVAMGDQGGCL
ncbi:MAG: ABC transporter ATP-binding protein, partial [Candidatus Thermoplasmatota archaeon]|nr:ABC transporter ATP-binding protein [Candidatus Thermoplasmatota archaeon]